MPKYQSVFHFAISLHFHFNEWMCTGLLIACKLKIRTGSKLMCWRTTISFHVGWLGSWVSVVVLSLLRLHLGALHSWAHHALVCSLRSWVGNTGVLLFELDSVDVLLVLNLLLDVLISLEEFVVFGLSQLQSFVQVGLELLLESIHLILLLLDELGLSSDDFLLCFLHVLLSFLDLKFLSLLLDLMSLGISTQI